MMKIGTDSVTFVDGHQAGDLTVPLPGGLLGLDAEGHLWASAAVEGEPLTDGDLQELLGSRGAMLGRAMAGQARRSEGIARGVPGSFEVDPAIRQIGGHLVVDPAEVGVRQLRLRVPRGVLAIGPELDVWRTVGVKLWGWGVVPDGPDLLDAQAAQLLMEVRVRWLAFMDEQLREWCPPMAAPRVSGDTPIA
jgi:hypothetical protein